MHIDLKVLIRKLYYLYYKTKIICELVGGDAYFFFVVALNITIVIKKIYLSYSNVPYCFLYNIGSHL